MQTNLFFVLLLIGSLVKLAWLGIEFGDPDTAGDDMSAILFIAIILLNHFL
jgi:hypothetical protein